MQVSGQLGRSTPDLVVSRSIHLVQQMTFTSGSSVTFFCGGVSGWTKSGAGVMLSSGARRRDQFIVVTQNYRVRAGPCRKMILGAFLGNPGATKS